MARDPVRDAALLCRLRDDLESQAMMGQSK